MRIHEIKEDMLAILADAYQTASNPKEVTDLTKIESEGFMRKKDADSIINCCKSNKMSVSFRVAGTDTIQRIAEGHPCKGHDIKDKSIKKGTDGVWTYLAPDKSVLGVQDDSILEKLKGFVGSPFIPQEKGQVDLLAQKGTSRVILNTDGSIKKIIYQLNEIYLLEEDTDAKGMIKSNSYSKIKVHALNTANIARAYTGDYDMHDLFVRGRRALATTPEEQSAIDRLNLAILNASKERSLKAHKMIGSKDRLLKSPYALIRHGAQTSFFDYMLSGVGEADLRENMENLTDTHSLPAEKIVVKIDEKIAMFSDTGKVYILNGVGEIYKYYAFFKLLDQVPFYNFFEDLKKHKTHKHTIEAYASYIQSILRTNLGAI